MCARSTAASANSGAKNENSCCPDDHEDGAAARQPAADDAPQHLVVWIPLLDEDGVHIMEVGQ